MDGLVFLKAQAFDIARERDRHFQAANAFQDRLAAVIEEIKKVEESAAAPPQEPAAPPSEDATPN